MKKELVKNLVLYLVDQLRDNDSPISTIRLIKFLYLIDLEHYKRYYETLTGIDWIRYTYGPYFFEWPNIVKSIGYRLALTEVKTEKGEGNTYSVDEPYSIEGKVSFTVQSFIDKLIKKWGDEDLDVILKFIYDTYPVRASNHKEKLDFTAETDYLLLDKEVKSNPDFDTVEEFLDSLLDK